MMSKDNITKIKGLIKVLNNNLSTVKTIRTNKDIDKEMTKAIRAIDDCNHSLSNSGIVYKISHKIGLELGIDFGFGDMPASSGSWRNRAWIQGECGSTKDMERNECGLTKATLRKYLVQVINKLNRIIK